MSSSTVFIAVQCFQCSTMQVKQRKKSNNKWNCVVCNEKQSVRKVFSQGFMAKDVRKFVQSFNMSRQFNEQQQDNETLAQLHTENQPNKKRTDWTEYIDLDINGDDDDERELCEPNVVTEMPKPLFKKPKLMNSYSTADDEKLQRPVFGMRKKFNNPVKETVKGGRVGDNQHNHDTFCHRSVYGRSNSMMKQNSKLNTCDDADGGFKDTGSSSVMVKLKRPVSKWDNFIDDEYDDDDDDDGSGYEGINAVAFEAKVSDEIVEDDVYPDFV